MASSLRGMRNLKFDPASNETLSLTALPSSLLDTVIPGYSVVSRLINDATGIDITSTVSLAILCAAIITGSAFLSRHIGRIFLSLFSCSITIDSHDFLYDQLLAWAASNPSIQKVRTLRGHSADEAIDADDPSTFVDLTINSELNDDDAIFNFKEWALKAPPRYEPNSTSGLFWHKSSISQKWNVYSLSRDREQVRGGWMGMQLQDREKLTITVLGRSTKPLKDLIVESRDIYFERQTSMTNIRRPAPKEQRGRGRSAWNKVASRPSRPMATVVLDDKQKATILRDMNEFLHPKTPRWYANRGIPYRRGYLFFGPPGTGKTSLSFALAGVFGLDIYCLSLSEITLTEEDLILLFNSLPKRCVVLLEDIDSAGVLRKTQPDDKEVPKTDESKEGEKKQKAANIEDDKPKDLESTSSTNASQAQVSPPLPPPNPTDAAATALATAITKAIESATSKSADANTDTDTKGPRSRRGPPRPSNPTQPSQTTTADGTTVKPGVTLSGLLNAIDGVASQEGRVLVMTTNYPDRLDPALIRPGRVDLKVRFDLAGKKEVRELFLRMYDVDDDDEEERSGKRRGGVVKRISEVIPGGEGGVGEVEEEDVNAEAKIDDTLGGEKEMANGGKITRTRTLPTPPGTPTDAAPTPHGHDHHRQHPAQSPKSTPVKTTTRSDISRLADEFSARLLPGVFSPADIQGFLLTRKKDPRRAVEEVTAWVKEELARKEKGSNVVLGDAEKEKKKAETGTKGE